MNGRARHHDLCFGCGLANVFGLHLEARAEGDGVEGRFFVKQDHQGADGSLHPGVLAAALLETLSLAADEEPQPGRIELELIGSAAVGTFVSVEANVADARPVARAYGEDGRLLAVAR